MIQVNKMVGFSNFDQYQLRKEYFIEGKRAYENELVRLAVNASFEKTKYMFAGSKNLSRYTDQIS